MGSGRPELEKGPSARYRSYRRLEYISRRQWCRRKQLCCRRWVRESIRRWRYQRIDKFSQRGWLRQFVQRWNRHFRLKDQFERTSSLVFILGGTNNDRATGVAVDPSGSAFVVGTTESSDFPASSGFDPSFGGSQNGFVAKISSTGQLNWGFVLGWFRP